MSIPDRAGFRGDYIRDAEPVGKLAGHEDIPDDNFIYGSDAVGPYVWHMGYKYHADHNYQSQSNYARVDWGKHNGGKNV